MPVDSKKPLEGASASRDENKICTFSVPFYAASIDEVLTVGESEYHGLVENGREWKAVNDGGDGYVVTVTYKGYLGDKEPDPKDTEQWSLDFDFSEEPIESHPKLKEIKAAFGGYFPELGEGIKFPQFMPKDTKAKSGLGKGRLKAGDKNPMFGTTTYAVMTARVTRTWSAKTIPRNLVNDIGKVYSSIPGAPEQISGVDFGSRDWMAMPPKISQNGDVWRIENEWLLSPPNGWTDIVYERAAKQ